MRRGIVADDGRQPGKGTEILDRNHLAMTVDQLLLAGVLPYCERMAFDEADEALSGEIGFLASSPERLQP